MLELWAESAAEAACIARGGHRAYRHPAAIRVDDATGRTLGWSYGEDEPTRRNAVRGLMVAEARRFAKAFARLPELRKARIRRENDELTGQGCSASIHFGCLPPA
jgi:hypothetical protein